MRRIISVLTLCIMLLSSIPAGAADAISHSTVIGTKNITIEGVADGAAGLPLTLTVQEGGETIHVDQTMINNDGSFSFTLPLMPEDVVYTYKLRHLRMAEAENGTFSIASADAMTRVLDAFTALNVGTENENRISVMTEFLTTPENATILNLNLETFNSLKNPSVVSEGMCDCFNELTSLELISAKFSELVLAQKETESEQSRKEKIISDIQEATPGDMLALIDANATDLGIKTDYGFELIKEAYNDGDTTLAEGLKASIQNAVTEEEFNRALANYAAPIAYELETWGKFEDIADYYRDIFGGVFDEAKETLTDIELASLKQEMQDVPDFADMSAVKQFVQDKVEEIVDARPPKGQGSGGGGGGGSVSGNKVSVVPSEPQANPVQTIFTDCDHVLWAKDSILRLKEKGIVNGKTESTFNPDDKTTREEFLKMLLLACNITPDENAKADFADVPADSWCSPYIAKAVELGIVTGISDSAFGTGREISRQDMAVLCYRMLTKLNRELPSGSVAEFADKNVISNYATDAVNTMQNAGIIKGMDGNLFEPLSPATRAQTAVIIDRLMNLQ